MSSVVNSRLSSSGDLQLINSAVGGGGVLDLKATRVGTRSC